MLGSNAIETMPELASGARVNPLVELATQTRTGIPAAVTIDSCVAENTR